MTGLPFTCVTFSFSALPFERAVKLVALLDLDRVDVDCYASSRHTARRAGHCLRCHQVRRTSPP